MTMKTNGDVARYQLTTAIANSLATTAGRQARPNYMDAHEAKRVADAIERLVRHYVDGTVDDDHTRYQA